MKNIFILALLCSLYPTAAKAQLYIQNGGSIVSTGAAVITCQNINLVNNGTYQQGPGGTTVFNGTRNDTLFGAGTTPVAFDTLEVATSGTGSLVLMQHVGVSSAVKFSSGLIDLHGKIVTLQPNAVLKGESETSRTTDTSLGGYITITQTLNAPNAANPGNLGASITSAQNLGSTIINRRHDSHVMNGSTYVPTAFKQYEITPANDNGLNATLRCQYFDAELNGRTETDLTFIKSNTSPYAAFTSQGYTSRNAITNYVEKTGINDLSLWAITSSSTPLPLTLLSFTGQCEGTSASLYWRTANEQHVSHFDIQQSRDAVQWSSVGKQFINVNAHNYTFRGSNNEGEYYRLSIVDEGGSYQYSTTIKLQCDKENDELSLYPNPARDAANLSLYTTTASLLQVTIYAANGSLVYRANRELQPGSQTLTLPLGNLAAGVYSVNAHWGNGQYSKNVQLVKQ